MVGTWFSGPGRCINSWTETAPPSHANHGQSRAEFQGHFTDMIREAELEDVQKSVQRLSSTNITAEVNKMIDPKGEIKEALKADPIKESQAEPDTAALSEPQGTLDGEAPETAPGTEPEQSSRTSRGQIS